MGPDGCALSCCLLMFTEHFKLSLKKTGYNNSAYIYVYISYALMFIYIERDRYIYIDIYIMLLRIFVLVDLC